MKICDIIHKFTDLGLTYEVVENGSYASFGFFTQNNLVIGPSKNEIRLFYIFKYDTSKR